MLEQVLSDSPVKLAADPLVELEGEKSGIKIVFESNRECPVAFVSFPRFAFLSGFSWGFS